MNFGKENLIKFCWRTKKGTWFREHHGYVGIYKIFTILEGLDNDDGLRLYDPLLLKPSIISADTIPYSTLELAKEGAEESFLDFVNYLVVNKECNEKERYTGLYS